MRPIKAIAILAGIFLLFAANLEAAELVAYWSFDENSGTVANDSVGGNIGTIRGDAKWVPGKKGSALEFNGKTCVEVKDSKSLHLTTLTLSAWIYPTAYPKGTPVWWAGIVGKSYYTESTYGIRLGESRKIHFVGYGPFGAGGKIDSFSYGYANKTEINLNQWYHVAVTYDNTQVAFYINGRLDSVYGEKRPLEINDQNILIGATYPGGRYFTGIIDEVKIYKGVLTPEEVEADYQQSGGSKDNPSSINIPEVKTPSKLDGTLDDPSWQNAAKVSLVDNSTGKPPAAATTGYMVYDKDNLYIGLLCAEPLMDKLKAVETQKNGKVWQDDCVEIFIDPSLSRKSYYHFVLNPLSTQAQDKWISPTQEQKGWGGNWNARTFRGKDFWSATIAIPCASLDFEPGVGTRWGLNLNRHRVAQAENSSWSPTFAGFHTPERFGIVRGLNFNFPFYQVAVSVPVLSYELRDGNIGLWFSENIRNYSGAPKDVTVRLTDLTTTSKVEEKVSLGEGKEKELHGSVPIAEKGRDYEFQLEVLDNASQRQVHCSMTRSEAPAFLQCYFTRDYYTREAIAVLNGKINIETAVPPNSSASLAIGKEDGRGLETKIPVSGKEFSLSADISSLAAGKHKAILSLCQGDRLVYSETLPLIKYPPARYEIKSDRENLWTLVNDKPFFAIGLMDIPQDKMPEYAKAGFNSTNGNFSPDNLDTAYYNGMMLVVSTYAHSAPRSFYSTKPLDELEKAIRSGPLVPEAQVAETHPAAFGYFWDEPGEAEAAGCAVEYKVTKEYDPYHLVESCTWQPAGTLLSPDSYDILANDPYWHPLSGEKITSHTDRVDNYWKIANQVRKPLWITPQSDGWDPSSMITTNQQRCQTYLDLIHEAKGIYYWTYSIASPRMRETLKQLAGEMRELSPVLLTRSPDQRISAGDTGVEFRAKVYHGKTYLIAANISEDLKKSIHVKVPQLAAGLIANVLFENRTLPMKEGTFTDSFAPYGTHVYEIAAAPESAGKPIEVVLEMAASEKTPPAEVLKLKEIAEWPGNAGFEETDEFGRPLYWESNLNWEYPEYTSIDTTTFYEGAKSLRFYIPKTTLFSKETGYGWTGPVGSFDLHSKDDALRFGNTGASVFKVALPDGKYHVVAVMRKPAKLAQLQNGTSQPLNLEMAEIPEIQRQFPSYEARPREYSFDVEVKDGSLDLDIDGSIFGLNIVPEDKTNGAACVFDFGTDSSPVKPGHKKVAAPQFPWLTVSTEAGAPPVKGGKEYTVSVYLKSDMPGFPLRIYVIDYAWGPYLTLHNDVEVGTDWKLYTLSFKADPSQTRVRIRFDTLGKPGTVWLDKVELKEKQ